MAAEVVDLSDLKPRLQKLQRLIGIDLGTKTIGLALSDVERRIASPLETIPARPYGRRGIAAAACLKRWGCGLHHQMRRLGNTKQGCKGRDRGLLTQQLTRFGPHHGHWPLRSRDALKAYRKKPIPLCRGSQLPFPHRVLRPGERRRRTARSRP